MYRIKIEELNNGEKRYIPQVGKPLLKIGRFNYRVVWWNIFLHPHHYWSISQSVKESYYTEEDALTAIECYKEFIQTLKGEEVKRTTYKAIKQ